MTHALVPIAAMYQQGEDHPHNPPGSPNGGQFATKNSSQPAAAKKTTTRPSAKRATHSGHKPTAKKAAHKAAPAAGPTVTQANHTLSRNGKNDPAEVKQLQQLLKALKLGNLTTDGVFGPDTEAAVKALQTKLGRKPTGHATSAMIRKLADVAALSPCLHASAAPEFVTAAAQSGVLTGMTGVELARPGTWHLSTGKRTFTADNLRDAADFFAASGQTRIPLGFGHSDSRFDGDPAFGWVSNIRYAEDAKGPVLLGDLVDVDDWLAAAAPKRWPNRSIEGFANLDWNGRTYSLALTRLALLGSTPPAMPILRSLADMREAVAAAAESSGAEFVSAAAPPSEQDTTDPASEAAVPTTRTEETGMDPELIREAFGLDADASDDEVRTALVDAGFIPEATPVAASTRSPKAELIEESGMVRIDASAYNELNDRVKRMEATEQRRRSDERDQVIAQAVIDGKFAPARGEHWARLWDKDPEGVRSMIASLARNLIPVAASGYAGDSDREDDEFDRELARLSDPNRQAVRRG